MSEGAADAGQDQIDSAELDELAQSFTGGMCLDDVKTSPAQIAHVPGKRNYSDNAWDSISPIPKKLDVDETPIFHRGAEDLAQRIQSPSHPGQ
jgi:hypothetical protein